MAFTSSVLFFSHKWRSSLKESEVRVIFTLHSGKVRKLPKSYKNSIHRRRSAATRSSAQQYKFKKSRILVCTKKTFFFLCVSVFIHPRFSAQFMLGPPENAKKRMRVSSNANNGLAFSPDRERPRFVAVNGRVRGAAP